MSTNTYRMVDLLHDLLDELEDRKEEIVSSSYPDEFVHEIVEGLIPIYHSDLGNYLAQNVELGFLEGGTCSECSNLFQLIQESIKENLLEKGMKWLEKEQERSA